MKDGVLMWYVDTQCSESQLGVRDSWILINGRHTVIDNKIRGSMWVRVVFTVTIPGWYLETVSYYETETCIFIGTDYILEDFITELSWNWKKTQFSSYNIKSKDDFFLDSDTYLTRKSLVISHLAIPFVSMSPHLHYNQKDLSVAELRSWCVCWEYY